MNKLGIVNTIAQGKRAFQNKNHLLTTNSMEKLSENVRMECNIIRVRDLDSKHNREEKTGSF